VQLSEDGRHSAYGDAARHIAWLRSSRCSINGSCVEVANLADGRVMVRDGKAAEDSPLLVFSGEEWNAFISGVKNGDFLGDGGPNAPAMNR
jgi:hypothetical protein